MGDNKKRTPISLSKLNSRRASARKRYHKNKLKAGKLSQPREDELWVAAEFRKFNALFTIILPRDDMGILDIKWLKLRMKVVKRVIRNRLKANASKEDFVKAMKEQSEDLWNESSKLSNTEIVKLWHRIRYT